MDPAPKKKNTNSLYNRGQFLQGLVLIDLLLVLSCDHMNDNVRVLSSSAAILKISIRLTQVIVIYAVQIIHCRCRRDDIDVCGIFINIVVVVVLRSDHSRRRR